MSLLVPIAVASLYAAWEMPPGWLRTMWLLFAVAAVVARLLRVPIMRRDHEPRRKRARAVTLAPPPDAPCHAGTVRALADTSPLPHGAVAAALTVREGDDVLLREVRATTFVIERDDAPPFRVLGEIELLGAATSIPSDAIHALEGKLGAHDWCGPRAHAESIVLRDGDRVEVHAQPQVARVAGGYRDGDALVAVGVPGRPLFVRRLTGGR